MRRGAEAIFCSIPARIGLLGNPSDGYNGQCISSLARNWRARCVLNPHENRWDFTLTIICGGETLEYKSLADLAENQPDLSEDGISRLVLGALIHFKRTVLQADWRLRQADSNWNLKRIFHGRWV